MLMYTRGELQAKRVPELKELAESFNLETKGLRKAEIIDVLVQYFESEIELEDSEEIQENEKMLEDIPMGTTFQKEIKEDECEIKQTPSILNLHKPKMLYKFDNASAPICHVSGAVKILEDSGKYYKVRVVISGRGNLVGYVLK